MSDPSSIIDVTLCGVTLHNLTVLSDSRGAVLHMIRADLPGSTNVGEVYFSEINSGVVKGWKRHLRMTQRLTVPVGRVKFVLYDDRRGSETYGLLASWLVGRPDKYRLLTIPPGIWYGFQGLDLSPSLIVNCPDFPHDPAESESSALNADTVPYRW